MTPKQILDLIKALIDVVEKDLIDPATGQFKGDVISKDLQAVADFSAALKSAGVAVPPNVDKIIQILPLVAALIGVK